MWSHDARALVSQISSAVVYVEIQDKEEKIGIGSAFHIGEGYFATARHVIHDKKILRVGRRDTSLRSHVNSSKVSYTTTYPNFEHRDIENIFYHPDVRVDVAIIKLAGKIGNVPAQQFLPILQLAIEADRLTEGEFLMQEAVVLGYPPIPFATDAHLVVFRGEVSALIESRENKRRHFVISGMARGGFSGGPVVWVKNPNAVLGVVVESLTKNNEVAELGFIAAVSAITVLETVEHHGLKIRSIEISKQGFILPPNKLV